MLLEYRDVFVTLYMTALWPLLLTGFLLNKDPNVKWFLLGFSIITAFSMLSGNLIKMAGAPSWVFHLSKIGIAIIVMNFILYRPTISVFIGRNLQKLPLAPIGGFMALFLPSHYPFRLVPAELALRRLYIAMSVVQCVVISHSLLVVLGIASRGGWLENHGFNRLVVWDAAYSAYLVFLILELLLLLIIAVGGVKARFRA